MIIINNNNNNGQNGGGPVVFSGTDNGKPEISPISTLLSQPLKYDRATMIALSRYMGWSGWHFFLFRKPFLGFCHLLFSVVGILGMLSFVFLFFFGAGECCVMYLLYASCAVVLLLASIFCGVLYSLYWSIRSDEDFKAAFPELDKKG